MKLLNRLRELRVQEYIFFPEESAPKVAEEIGLGSITACDIERLNLDMLHYEQFTAQTQR